MADAATATADKAATTAATTTTTATSGTAAATATTGAAATTTTDKSQTASTTAASTTAATTGTTAAATGATDDKTASTANDQKGYWPQDWVTRVSKGDEKIAKQLGRYASPEALAEAHLQLRRRMDSGEFKAALPKSPTAEDLKAWRKDNGIPEKADAYDLKGIEIPEEDRKLVGNLTARLHAKNASNDVVRDVVASYYELQQQNEDRRAAKDETDRGTTIDSLSSEWGNQFTRNKNLVGNVLTKFPESVREMMKSARFDDGTAIFNHPDVMRGFLALELERNPAGVTVHAGDGDLGKSMVDRYKEIGEVMRKDRDKYNKDAGMQREFTQLIDAMQKQNLIDKNGNLIERKAA